jgi:hypothetical protein
MTTPTIVATGLAGDRTDFNKVKRDTFGAERTVTGTASVTSGTAADAFVGLVPFQKGAIFDIHDKSVHCGDFGAGTTTVNLGIIYDDDTTYTNDVDAFASLSTAAQSGGFISIDEIEGLTLKTEANGYLAVQLKAAAADATADITFNVTVSYGS